MKLLWGLLVSLLPMAVSAHSINNLPIDSINKGIRFETGLNWAQVLAKAKAENKYIFVDCYTTWCGPCKQMENSVYPLEKVGKYFNDKLISVKAQMDTSKKDDAAVKSWYADAHYLQEQYKVDAFPTFLFFTPDGKILYKSVGAKAPDEFLALAADALNPEKDYYKLLEHFKQGKEDLTEMSHLARTGLSLGDTATARKMAEKYIAQLKNKALLTKENIQFMHDFTKSSADKGFKLFYLYGDSINKIMGNDTYSQQFVHSLIYKELVLPAVEKADRLDHSTPDWSAIAAVIKKKYNEYYSERVITGARCTWGINHKNWSEYTKYLVLFQENFGSKSNNDAMASLVLNNYAWDIFQHSKDRQELIKALSWSSRAVMMNPSNNWMDTYANILYKLDRKKEAIMWEEIAAKLSPTDTDIQVNLEKMKKGEPTWPTN